MKYSAFSELLGKTLVSATRKDVRNRWGRIEDGLEFVTDSGETFVQFHQQDCCESVYLEDINGDLEDLVGAPILLAEEVSNSGGDNYKRENKFEDWPEDAEKGDYEDESWTWTFYKLSTIKGSVTIRWYGSSNGYYSESVDFYKVEND